MARKSIAALRLRLKYMHCPYNVLPADGALAHPFATLCARDHMTTFQKNTVNDCIHADPAQIIIVVIQLHLLSFCKATAQGLSLDMGATGEWEDNVSEPVPSTLGNPPDPWLNMVNPMD